MKGCTNPMMISMDEIEFRTSLLDWFHCARRPMPWRETSDPYQIWVSEVMLQQTQVATVIDYFNRFIRAFPDIETLARARDQDVLKLWEGLGYYSRARNLHNAARELASQGLNTVPDTPGEFMKLPGVGPYTCAAVQSIAYNHALAVVDGNVKRVLARLFEMEIPVNDSCVHQEFARNAERLLDRGEPAMFNQAMMELGALVCRPTSPLCDECPVRQWCNALAHGTVAEFPRRKEKKVIPTRHHAAAAVLENGQLLVIQRRPHGFLGGMWELPGGSVKKNESPDKACIRTVKAQTGLSVETVSHLARVTHTYSHFRLELDVFAAQAPANGVVDLNGPEAHQWIRWSQIDTLPFHKAIHKCFPSLKPLM